MSVKKKKLKVKEKPKGKKSKLKKKPPTPQEIEAGLDLELPTEKNNPSSDIGDYAFHIYGAKGIGKTSLAARFPNSFSLQFEPGGKALKTFQRGCPTWMHFRKYVQLLDEDSSMYSNVVIDTAQLSYDRCLDYVCTKKGCGHPGEMNDYGATWKLVSTEFASQMNKLGLMDLGFFAISHDVDKEIATKSGRKFMKCMPNLSGQAESYFSGPIDVVGHYYYDGEDRWLQIRGNDYVEAKCRLEDNFIALDGQPVYKIPMGDSPKEAYENLVAAFNNEQEDSYTPEETKLKKKPTKTKTKTKSKIKRKR